MHPLKSRILDYCLTLKHTEESFPFDQRTWVAKVHGKMFALMDILDDDVRINLKCDPDRAEELRTEYDWILPGYHMSKKHWNTVVCDSQPVDWTFLKELINHSYELVYASLPKKIRDIDHSL